MITEDLPCERCFRLEQIQRALKLVYDARGITPSTIEGVELRFRVEQARLANERLRGKIGSSSDDYWEHSIPPSTEAAFGLLEERYGVIFPRPDNALTIQLDMNERYRLMEERGFDAMGEFWKLKQAEQHGM